MVTAQDIRYHTISSEYGIFTPNGLVKNGNGLEIDRVVKEIGAKGLISYLRVRNASKSPIKILSFLVADLVLPYDIKIESVLENGWLQCSNVSFKKTSESTKRNKVFLERDQNPYSFMEKFGYLPGSVVSEWFTIVKMFGNDLLIGAVTTGDQFSQIFIKDNPDQKKFRITCQYDGLILKPGQTALSEKIYIVVGSEVEIENEFANLLKKEMKVKDPPPPIKAMCCSYYWHGNNVDENLINKELDALEGLPEKLDLDFFQIDAGYTKYFGDWFDYRERFPNGFEPIVSRIKAMGYRPGIWVSPFAVSPATKLHQEHKSWFFLKDINKKGDGDGGHFEGRLTSPFDSLSNSLNLEVLDPTLPEVQKYLADVFRHFKDLGFDMFKVDFMYPVCLAEKYYANVTRAKALRIGMECIRKAVGNSFILTCISQISPLVGIADFVRTGIDTLNPFVCGLPLVGSLTNNFMIARDDEENKDRAFLNGRVWRADPDVQVFRYGTGISNDLIKKHLKLTVKNKMSLWVGDSIANMSKDVKEKLLKVFNATKT